MTTSAGRAPVRRRDELNAALELVHFGFRALVAGPDARLATRGLGRAQHRLLYFIAREPDQSLQSLCDRLRITRQALHEGMGPLLRARLVRFAPDARDRRRRLVRLTRRGEVLEDSLTGEQRELMARVFRSCGPDAERGWRQVMSQLASQLPEIYQGH